MYFYSMLSSEDFHFHWKKPTNINSYFYFTHSLKKIQVCNCVIEAQGINNNLNI